MRCFLVSWLVFFLGCGRFQCLTTAWIRRQRNSVLQAGQSKIFRQTNASFSRGLDLVRGARRQISIAVEEGKDWQSLCENLNTTEREAMTVRANYLNLSDGHLFGSGDARVAASIRDRVRKTAKTICKQLRLELAAGAADTGRKDVKSKTYVCEYVRLTVAPPRADTRLIL